MKRWFLALAALLVGAVSASYADYIIIQYNLSASGENENQNGPQLPGGPGGSGAGMMSPGPGGSGAGMMSPGPGGPGTFPGGGGAFPGGSGALPGGSGGFPGGMSGMPGGFPGGMPFGQAAEDDDVPLEPLYVYAVVETHNVPNYAQMKRGLPVKITHRWGTTVLQPQNAKTLTSTAQGIKYIPIIQGTKPVPSVKKRFEAKMRDAHKDGKAGSDQLLELADWALGHAYLDGYEKVMDELVQSDKDNRAAAAYVKTKAALDRGAGENAVVNTWKAKLGLDAYKIAQKDKGHYTLLYSSGPGGVQDTDERLSLLENSFRGYYYWFALQGQTLPVPAERLLAIAVAQTGEFNNLHRIFDDPPLVADGFCARRDNLLVFSANRLDEPYKNLEAYVEPALRRPGQDMSTLLKGRGPYEVQTAVLMLKALQLDGEIATTTQEVPRQLLAASGLLARNVEIPHWTQFGIGSFFGTAKSSAWASVGSPSCAIMPQDNFLYTYKTWSKGKKLDEPKVALERVVTDEYFRVNKDGKDKVAEQKARTLSWALTYYLAHRKLDGLLRYYKELSKLPRDLPFDNRVLLGCFARSFDLTEVNDPSKVNAVKFAQMANEWNDYINQTPTELEEIIKELVKTENELKTKPGAGAPGGQPGGGYPAGGRPGGFPGAGAGRGPG